MKTSLLRRKMIQAACLSCLGVASLAAHAEQPVKWPEKVVRIVVAGPAGGTADIVARLLGDQLTKDTGQPVVVDAKPGAGGALAVNELSMAPHDGYTLLVGVSSLVSEIPHIVKLRNDMSKEIRPVAELGRGGLVMVGAPSVPAKNFAELVSWVKANPGKVSYASYSPGTVSHVIGLQLNKAAGMDMTHVGYKGSTPALTDVMGGHVPLMFDGMATSLPMIKAGKIKAFAVSTPKRSALLPDVPTFAELGYPQLETVSWMGLWIKPDVPAAVQASVREAALKAISQPAVRTRLLDAGLEAGSGRTPDELVTSLNADYKRVGEVLKSIDFKPE
ncbi:tripartite tricarboxylate transporter substrate binding protein [Variovorax sp. Sphag1AA]|uniref:Bug family tripartite tricarboxylate transporter substrate binding protein n=1 Tax=Variovorax sp. Sphag1AA TaxID=2587027 RepID=UPI0018282770|nr:tripartite tricarboxylate transporter substrate binding protein [Variovorax sp. Sphag1AA]MBB3175855.1 tripartite-type tricarboxylate transporter receptor subunit TctC [Variovorax sp. Sphag1AA]